ncbi:MAG: helix-turn-helix transcriptional regulator [Marinosulfonomonas sp.]|nr:helix-turn-helix transcriptional regulator [Marinosulfonomonas sp.]
MRHKTDKRARATLFRTRLGEALEHSGMTRSALSRAVGVDRSTISQLLKGQGTRLPNAQVVGECAATLGVSADWLLGLTEHRESAADLLASSMTMPHASRALEDEQIFNWHQEATGYKIRHVPATLPDMLKTHDMLVWEYSPQLGRSTEQAIGATQDRLGWLRANNSDYEMAIPLHEMASFARGEGYYTGLPAEVRRAQIDWMLELHDQLYPSLRLFLFDARRLFSAPISIFGPLLAVLYLGRNYLAFRDKERVQGLIGHFDWLVRESEVSPRDVPEYLRGLRGEIG